MPRDYKNRSSRAKPKPRAKPRGSRWPLLLGLVIGLGVALAVHMHHSDRLPLTPPAAQPAPSAPVAKPAKPEPTVAKPSVAEPPPEQRPRFEFYQILPEMEIVVPEEEPRPRRGQAEPAPEAPAQPDPLPRLTPGNRYMLQAGSFRNFSDADRLKAQLALVGVEASIQAAEVRPGETWHRVRIGPFTEQAELDRVNQRLESNGVQAILLRQGGG